MIKKILLVLVVLIILIAAGLAFAISRQPDEYRVSRTTSIAAPSERVHENVNNFTNWSGWSPWAKIDPNMTVTLTGPPAGVGARYAWKGNSEVGEGTMAITDSRPDAIKIDLEFKEPFQSTAVTDFAFKNAGDKTDVTWTLAGKHNLMSKAMCLVVDMDKMMGPDLEKGLATLKSQSEAPKP